MKILHFLMLKLFIIFLFFQHYAAASEILDLKSAIDKTIENSWNIKNSILDTKIADDKLETAKDVYQPTFTSGIQHSYNETGATVISPVPSTETRQDEWSNSISKMFESGLSGDLSANLTKTDSTIPTFGDLDDNRKNLILSFSYPLIKNRAGRTLRYPVEIAELNKNISLLQYDFLIEQEILSTIISFYEVCLLIEEKKAVLANLEGAKSVEETIKRKYEIGTSEAKDYFRSQAAVSAQKTRVIATNNLLAKSKLNLLRKMGERDISKDLDVDYDLATSISHIQDKAEIVLTSFPQRKDLQQLENQIKILGKTISIEEDNKAPNLDISTSYATDGLGGNNTFSESETPAWLVGVTFKKTFGGESRISDSLKQKEKLQNTVKDAKQNISEEIYFAISDVNHLVEALEEAENLANIQTKRLAEEEKDFNLGRTSVRDIEEARNDLTSAQLVLAQAKINVIRAYARLLFVSGELNKNFHMRLR